MEQTKSFITNNAKVFGMIFGSFLWLYVIHQEDPSLIPQEDLFIIIYYLILSLFSLVGFVVCCRYIFEIFGIIINLFISTESMVPLNVSLFTNQINIIFYIIILYSLFRVFTNY